MAVTAALPDTVPRPAAAAPALGMPLPQQQDAAEAAAENEVPEQPACLRRLQPETAAAEPVAAATASPLLPAGQHIEQEDAGSDGGMPPSAKRMRSGGSPASQPSGR